jgi:phosphoserine phosphatase
MTDFSTYFFDCDSTLCTIEGIDELARMKGVEDEIIPLTEKAMTGELPLSAVFEKRLEIIRPTQADLERLGELYIETITSGAEEIIKELLAKGKTVGIISAGYDLPLFILGEHLGISEDTIYGNTIFFDAVGQYTGFDSDNPLSREDGKLEIVKTLQDARPMLYVGDGVSDLMVAPYVDLFVGFGGVRVRPDVKAGAEVFIEEPSFSFLTQYL